VHLLTERQANAASYLTIGLQLLAVLWALPTAAASLLLLGVADTGLGRTFAVAALLSAILPYAAVTAWAGRSKRWIQGTCAMVVAVLVLVVVLIANATVARPDPVQGRVTNQFTGQVSVWLRYSPTNLVPEGDQLLFGFTLMSSLDPILTSAKATELRRMTAMLYREQSRDADFAQLGSVMPEAYAELFGFSGNSGHSYVYVPNKIDRSKPSPVLVFFHGSGGNFKAYLWELAELADKLGFVLVAPSSGLGQWYEDQSVAALDSALVAAGRVASIDAKNVHIMGLSNGGRAISQLAALQGSRFKSLVFLSPVFDDHAIASASFARQCSNRPVLVLTGARDDRTPLRYVEENIRGMTRGGAKIEMQTTPEADHFLMFSHRRQLVEAMATWLKKTEL